MKEVILNENQFKTMIQEHAVLDLKIVAPKHTEKQYPIDFAKVALIKKFLDSGFMRGEEEELGPSGYPEKIPCFAQLDSNKNVLRNLHQEDMIDLLLDKYQDLCIEQEETERLIKRVLQDWYNKDIKPYGGLSVNHV